jgi:hypothetical protein
MLILKVIQKSLALSKSIRVFQTDDSKRVIEFISDIILRLYNEGYIIKRPELLVKILI